MADFSAHQLRAHLASQIGGTQKEWADRFGLAPAYVSDVLAGRREPGPAILAALGFERIVLYRPIIEENDGEG